MMCPSTTNFAHSTCIHTVSEATVRLGILHLQRLSPLHLLWTYCCCPHVCSIQSSQPCHFVDVVLMQHSPNFILTFAFPRAGHILRFVSFTTAVSALTRAVSSESTASTSAVSASVSAPTRSVSTSTVKAILGQRFCQYLPHAHSPPTHHASFKSLKLRSRFSLFSA